MEERIKIVTEYLEKLVGERNIEFVRYDGITVTFKFVARYKELLIDFPTTLIASVRDPLIVTRSIYQLFCEKRNCK